ncbi:MFS transporter [Bradyrhizobium guangdongense]|uniref:MFS transporter n=1 Tax=Bradyrhizobium guangdongense TaxID=1325090 RepID=A0A410V822_9BRAD|nr:MFS transporter [Bradyrhizobium guangdongense]QAU39767.1 MFS transporter [Bradyrhizobium guangdongense]QOZ60832.1 MFS transporter [Bradyrhizobium guangdongense]GGI25597.1 MFS transporter [Bradyrhizobium guangdongense]
MPSSSSLTTGPAVPARAYAVLIMLFLFQTINFFDKLVFGLSAVPMMKELSLSPKEFGLIGSSFFLLFSLSGMAVGLFVVGRFPAKWILLLLAAIWSATQLPVFFSSSVMVLVVCRILLGAGEGPGLPTALHACYNWFPADKRSVPSAVVLQGISVGLLAGGPLLTYVIINHGWRTGFLVCGLLGIAWMFAWSVIGGEGPYAAADIGNDATAASPKLPARLLWCDPTVIGVIIMSTMSYWIVGISATWLPPFLQLGLGYKPTDVGWIISAIYMFQSPLLLSGSWITQVLQRRGWSLRACLGNAAGLALLIAGCALLLSIVTTGAFQLACVAIAFAAPSLTTIFGPVALGAVAPAAQRGRLIVVIYSGNAASALFSNALTGWIVGEAGSNSALGYAHAMTFTAGILIVGAVAAFALIFPERTIARFAKTSSPSSSATIVPATST